MSLLAAFDPYLLFALSVGFVLALCVGIIALMRDPYSVPPHPVSRRVWCASKHRSAEVDFVESVVTGMVRKSVERCSLRGTDESCDEACRYETVESSVSPR